LVALVACWDWFVAAVLGDMLVSRFPALLNPPGRLPMRGRGDILLQAVWGGGEAGFLVECSPRRMVLLDQAELFCVFYGTAGLVDAAAAVLGDQEEGA
jgi:hypothetical protein